MSEREWQTYYDFYLAASSLLPPPDLIVCLKAKVSTLVERIVKRGREYEANISEDYLGNLNRLYDEWANIFSVCPILTIETDDLDYLHNDSHLLQIVKEIQTFLYDTKIN